MLGHQRVLVLEPTLAGGARHAAPACAAERAAAGAPRNGCSQPCKPTGRAHPASGRGCAEDEGRHRDSRSAEVVGNAANMGEPAALHGRFNKGIVALRGTGRGGVPDRQLAGRRQVTRRGIGWRRYVAIRADERAHPRSGSDGGRRLRLARRPWRSNCRPAPKRSARRGDRRTALVVSRRDGSDLTGKTDAGGADPGSRAHACRNRDGAAHSAQWPRAARAGRANW